MDIEKEIKIYLILGVIVLGYYGLWLFLSYESWVAVNNWPLFDPAVGRYLGATYVAWAIIVLKLLLKDIKYWEKIENWIIFGVIANILNTIAGIISIIAYPVPLVQIINIIINIFFTLMGIHILIQKRK